MLGEGIVDIADDERVRSCSGSIRGRHLSKESEGVPIEVNSLRVPAGELCTGFVALQWHH